MADNLSAMSIVERLRRDDRFCLSTTEDDEDLGLPIVVELDVYRDGSASGTD